MPEIYVAGAVIRDSTYRELPHWVRNTYSDLEAIASDLGLEARLPRSRPELERAAPSTFFQEIHDMVSSADVVVTIFTSGDISVGIEATIGSLTGKKQLIVAEDEQTVPRLLRGLPGVIQTATAADRKTLRNTLQEFLRDNLRGGAAFTVA